MSSKEVIVYGKVSNEGELTITNRGLFYDTVGKRFSGKNIEIGVRLKRKTRSKGQIGYYFGLLIPMIIAHLEDTQGRKFSKEDVDNDLRNAFLYEEDIDIITGEVKKRIKSLKEVDGDVNTLEMMLFIEDCRDWAASTLFLDIPDPNPNWQYELEEAKQKQNQIDI